MARLQTIEPPSVPAIKSAWADYWALVRAFEADPRKALEPGFRDELDRRFNHWRMLYVAAAPVTL